MNNKKPSTIINDRVPALTEALFNVVLKAAGDASGYEFTPADRADFTASKDGKICLEKCETAAALSAIVEYLDAEWERRAAPTPEAPARGAPIPCSDRMPDPEARVLAFVPSQPEGRRWRVAQWCAPPAQYTDESWRDEESMVGDEAYRWQPKQVTHWMPMPEEPT